MEQELSSWTRCCVAGATISQQTTEPINSYTENKRFWSKFSKDLGTEDNKKLQNWKVQNKPLQILKKKKIKKYKKRFQNLQN